MVNIVCYGELTMFSFKAVKEISLKEQLIEFGYFPEEIPDCFNSKDLYDKYEMLKNHANKKEWSESTSFTISKKSNNRRQIKIPNPEQQILLIEYILNHKDEIKCFLEKSRNTQSNPFHYTKYKYSDVEFLDIPRLKNVLCLPSTYMDNIIEKVRSSMGYKYKLKLDLSNFYDSIYTHTLEWATKGREKAKKDLRKKRNTNDLGKELDAILRKTNANETSGIPIGPFTSRIISELLLVKVDAELSNLGFNFKRYVDDYEFYFKSEDEIINKNEIIRRTFYNYRLRINEQKTEVLKYPYNNNVDLNRVYDYYLKKLKKETDDKRCCMIVLNLFSKADEFYKNGQKGAYKYLFKMIAGTDFKNTWHQVEAFIINTILILPSLTQFAAVIVLNNLDKITEGFKFEILENLKNSCLNKYDNEAQWLFWLLMKIDYRFTVSDLELLFRTSEDSILNIMIIDYADKYKKSSKKLQVLIEEYYNKISQFSIYSEYWLVIYECYVNKWFDYRKLEPVIKKSKFFMELNKEGVLFYKF